MPKLDCARNKGANVEKETKNTTQGAEAKDMLGLLGQLSGFINGQAQKGALMPSTSEMFILLHLSALEARIKKLERPLVVVP